MSDLPSPESLTWPESGGGRSTCRSKPKPGVVFSYAAIGLMKENMQAVIPHRPGYKTPSDRDRPITDDLTGSFKQLNVKADLQQRTGPTKENALLRAELEVLRQQNTDLANRLQIAENQLEQHKRQSMMLHCRQSGELQQQLSSLSDGQHADGLAQPNAQAAAGDTVAQLETARQALGTFLLQPDEIETAALHCCWLVNQWELAQQFGLYPTVADSRAAYWRALAPPTEAIIQSAQHVNSLLWQQMNHVQPGGSVSSPATAAPAAARSDWLTAEAIKFAAGMQASVADLVGIELGLRELAELGVESAVRAALAQQTAAERTMLQLPPAAQDGFGMVLLPALLSQTEAKELQLQQAYLAYLWGTAALAGIEPQVSVSRAEHWSCRMSAQPTVTDFQDVHQGFQEMTVLAVEQQLWRNRQGDTGGMLAASVGVQAAAPSTVAARPTAMLQHAALLQQQAEHAKKHTL